MYAILTNGPRGFNRARCVRVAVISAPGWFGATFLRPALCWAGERLLHDVLELWIVAQGGWLSLRYLAGLGWFRRRSAEQCLSELTNHTEVDS